MVTLETKDNQDLILMLEQQDAMEDAESRRAGINWMCTGLILP